MWTRDPDAEKLVTSSSHLTDPEIRWRSWLMHGTVHEVECTDCEDRASMAAALDRVAAGEPDPACAVSGGVLESPTVRFGQALDAAVIDAAAAAAADCDVFLAVGTSLWVHPAAGLVEVAAASGARVVIVNAEPTPYDGIADLIVRTPISSALLRLLGPR